MKSILSNILDSINVIPVPIYYTSIYKFINLFLNLTLLPESFHTETLYNFLFDKMINLTTKENINSIKMFIKYFKDNYFDKNFKTTKWIVALSETRTSSFNENTNHLLNKNLREGKVSVIELITKVKEHFCQIEYKIVNNIYTDGNNYKLTSYKDVLLKYLQYLLFNNVLDVLSFLEECTLVMKIDNKLNLQNYLYHL